MKPFSIRPVFLILLLTSLAYAEIHTNDQYSWSGSQQSATQAPDQLRVANQAPARYVWFRDIQDSDLERMPKNCVATWQRDAETKSASLEYAMCSVGAVTVQGGKFIQVGKVLIGTKNLVPVAAFGAAIFISTATVNNPQSRVSLSHLGVPGRNIQKANQTILFPVQMWLAMVAREALRLASTFEKSPTHLMASGNWQNAVGNSLDAVEHNLVPPLPISPNANEPLYDLTCSRVKPMASTDSGNSLDAVGTGEVSGHRFLQPMAKTDNRDSKELERKRDGSETGPLADPSEVDTKPLLPVVEEPIVIRIPPKTPIIKHMFMQVKD